MKKTLIYFSLVILGGSIILNGCKKDKEEEPTTNDSDTQTAQDNSLAEGTFGDVNNIAQQAVENGNSLTTYRTTTGLPGLLSACATVTLTPNVPPTPGGNIVVDFGATPCLCSDYRYRKGVVNIAYTGMYRDSGTVIVISFNNFYVGTDSAHLYKVMGTKNITNKGHNTSGNSWFQINVNGSLQNSSGQTMTWVSARTREWIAGESTQGLFGWADDEYKISGSINGTTFSGNSFTINITQALHIALNCRWIKDGKFEYTPSGRATRTVDYGGGNCDNQATVTISGFVFPITLN